MAQHRHIRLRLSIPLNPDGVLGIHYCLSANLLRQHSKQQTDAACMMSADQEQASAGFWPGSPRMPEPALFAYTAPEPPGSREASIQPDAAFFHPELSEFILPYERVRTGSSPDRMILDFFQSAYEAGASLPGWDRAALERPDPLRR